MTYNDGVAKIILGNTDFNGLSSFFDRVRGSHYMYKVAMARRCFNLYRVLESDSCENGSDEVITDNGLLLYADDFAGYYRRHGFFPSLLLFDDVMLYGRTVYNALYRLERLVFEILLSEGDDVDMWTVHQRMHAATDIFVYAMSDMRDVIDNSYLYKVSCERYCYGSEMLQLTRNISQFLTMFGEANSSHVLSTRAALGDSEFGDRPKWKQWELLDWHYKGHKDRALFRVDETGSTRAVHVFRREMDADAGCWLMGFPCATDIKSEVLEDMCTRLAGEIGEAGKSERLTKALSSNLGGYASFKMSLLSFIDSAETLCRLAEEMGWAWDEMLEASDLSRIARSFGRARDVDDALYAILHNRGAMHGYSRDLRLGAECIGVGERDSMDDGLEGSTRRSENILCKVGMESEEEAYEYSHNLKTFRPLNEDRGKKPFKEYLHDMRATQDRADRLAIACEMSMLRYGINSMGFDMTESGDVSCYLKAGELSTHTFPQRHRYLLPSLARIETAALAHSYPPARLLKLFVKSLLDDVRKDPLEAILPGESSADLEENFCWYVDKTYKAGKSMARWNEVIWGDEAFDDSSDSATRESLSELLLNKATAFLRRQLRYVVVSEA